MKKVTALLLVILLLGKGLSTSVFAQVTSKNQAQSDSATASPEATTVPVDTIFHKTQNTERIQELLVLYQGEVEDYRKLEREFQINKAQFQKLNTLQSLEEAVQSTKKVMISRDMVLITYFELLHASLEETEGIEVTLKAQNLKNLEDRINTLKDHQKKVEDTTDRAGIADRVTEFVPIAKTIGTSAYSSIALIVTGNLQAVYDKSVILYSDIKKYHTDHPVSAVKQGERNRAYTEIDNNVSSLAMNLNDVRNQIATESKKNYGISINQIIEQLNKSYSGTALLLSHLKELLVDLT